MNWFNSYLGNRDFNTHLRDARHAHNLFTEYGHIFSPKTKFLYHVVFEVTDDVSNFSNFRQFQKQIGVLVKTADLPGFRADIQNKQQYNRKKNMQTRLDYQDVNLVLHDDNLGATRAMLEEYYRFYFQDGNHSISSSTTTTDGSFAPRDKYAARTPNYGLNNFYEKPFFKSIKIYQLSLQNWFSYTLVNPLLSAWNHGGVDSTDGSSFNENTISIAYESVLYDNGLIGENSEPTNFTDPETGYDNEFSPLTSGATNTQVNIITPILNKLTESIFGIKNPVVSTVVSGIAADFLTSKIFNTTSKQPRTSSTIPGYFTPLRDTQNDFVPDVQLGASARTGDPESTWNRLQANPSAFNSFLAKTLNTGLVEGLDYSAYLRLSPEQKTIILSDIESLVLGGDFKLFNFMKSALGE